MDRPLTLLLVEGHPGVRTALARCLDGMAGVGRVATASTLEEAVRLRREVKPDVILYDPRTVAGDPAAVLGALHCPDCPVIILTSTALDEEVAMLRRAGGALVLLKGLRVSDLLAQVQAVCTGRFVPQAPGPRVHAPESRAG
jgi:DNA-binding NarL/FixJ family response regulator